MTAYNCIDARDNGNQMFLEAPPDLKNPGASALTGTDIILYKRRVEARRAAGSLWLGGDRSDTIGIWKQKNATRELGIQFIGKKKEISQSYPTSEMLWEEKERQRGQLPPHPPSHPHPISIYLSNGRRLVLVALVTCSCLRVVRLFQAHLSSLSSLSCTKRSRSRWR